MQEALVYPAVARVDGETGVVVVEFEYYDGVVSNAHVVISSHQPILDRAAVETVQATHFPPPPSKYVNRQIAIQTIVKFGFSGRNGEDN
ncbi:MAG: energy transducer TonB [Acidiphilium sp.]|nr:energy transducer TonB [Acidiphilium sp.]MDD4936388.1 energy transducer TonB [Acidiphilium sp.]